MERYLRIALIFALVLTIMSCSYNPFRTDARPTGKLAPTAIGAAAGAGTMWAFHAPDSVIALGGILGGTIGYYVSTQHFAAKGIEAAGGQVYTLGDFVTIEIPNYKLFEPNSTDFTPEAGPILESVVDVLNRYPNNNVMISGNSSGYSSAKIEQPFSEARAAKVAAYLWGHGVNSFKKQSSNTRKLIYTGYGNYFPIANNIKAYGIQANSRIQITAYPTTSQLKLDKRHKIFDNIGGLDESQSSKKPPIDYNRMFPGGKILPEGTNPKKDDIFSETRSENRIYPSESREPVAPMPAERPSYKGERGFKGEGGF